MRRRLTDPARSLSRCKRSALSERGGGIAIALSMSTSMIHFPPADRGQTELFGEPDR
jgi:hypothetical protein